MSGTTSSSTENLAGFAIERRLGDGVWEATQPELGRRVLLRRLESFDAAAWPDRPGVPALYAVVPTPEGTYVATRFLPGARTLADLRGSRTRRRAWVDAAAAVLDGTVHGRLTEHDVLVADGRVYVTGFGCAAPGATAADDATALAGMRPERRPRLAIGVIAGVGAVVAAAVLLIGVDEGEPVPPVAAGATAFGSALAVGPVETIDCQGDLPSGDALPCTIMQAALPGRRLVAPGRQLVQDWVVRGASGRISLTVLRRQGDGWVVYNRSRPVLVKNPNVATLVPADLTVPRGAQFGIELSPGSGVGVRRNVRGASTQRLPGLVRLHPVAAESVGGGGEELLLRVDVVARFEG